MELVQSLGLGRVANLTATLLVAFFANLVLCMAMVLGLFLITSGNMPFSSSLNFALATTALLIGYLPRLSWLSYLYLGYSVITIYLGRLLNFPDFLEKLTPFGYISNYPLQPISATALLTHTVASLLLIFLGLLGYRRRDLA